MKLLDYGDIHLVGGGGKGALKGSLDRGVL